MFPPIAQPRESRGLRAANSSLTNNTERTSVARGRALGPMSPNATQRGQALSTGQVQSICEHKQGEGNKAVCDGGKYRSKMGGPAWQPGPDARCYIRHKVILIKY